IQQNARDLLRKTVHLAGGGVQRPLKRDVEPLLLGPSAMIGETDRFLDNGVDIDRPVFAGALPRVQQHLLDDGVCALAVLNNLAEIVPQSVRQFGYFSACLSVSLYPLQAFLQFIDQLDGNSREVVDEIERVFDFVGDASGQLAERGKLLSL